MAKPTPYRERKLSSLGIVEKDAIEGSFIVEADCVKNCFDLLEWHSIEGHMRSTRICLDAVIHRLKSAVKLVARINAHWSSTLDV